MSGQRSRIARARSGRAGGRRYAGTMDHEIIAQAADEAAPLATDELVEELLIEEISIDGMCGVY